MFYNNAAVEEIAKRIGWSRPLEPSNITLSNANLESLSGRTFDSFHKLVTVSNVQAILPDPRSSNDTVNAALFGYKKQAVLLILNEIFDINPRAYSTVNNNRQRVDTSNVDFSSLILQKISVFDKAFGYQVAVNVLQDQLTSNRSNATERNVKESQGIRVDLEGYFEDGKQIAVGIKGKLLDAIAEAINILFPPPEDKKKRTFYDASNKW